MSLRRRFVGAVVEVWKVTDSISKLKLPAKTARVLERLGVKTMGQLLDLVPEDAKRWPGFGSVAARAIHRVQKRLRAERPHAARTVQHRRPQARDEAWVALVAGLTGRACRALDSLKVKSVEQFVRLHLHPEQMRGIPGVGESTIRALVSLQQKLRSAPGSGPFGAEAARQLPLFCGIPAQPAQLHASYCGEAPVSRLKLPVRAASAVAALGIRTLGQLLCTSCDRLRKSGNFGAASLKATQAAVLTFLRQWSGAAQPGTTLATGSREYLAPWRTRFAEEAARELPLFLGGSVEPAELHESYGGGTSIHELVLPSRALIALEREGIHTVGQLLCVPYASLSQTGSFGLSSLKATQEAMLEFLRWRNGRVAAQKPLNIAHFKQFVEGVLSRCIDDKRLREVLRRRIGLVSGQPSPREQIAQEFGLTYERIRQMEQMALGALRTSWRRPLLAPFVNAAQGYLVECGGIASHEAFAAAMAERLRWSPAPAPRVAAALLAACDAEYRVNAHVIEREHRCRKCSRARAAVEDLAMRQAQVACSRISFGQVREVLRLSCGRGCNEPENSLTAPSDAFLRELIKWSEGSKTRLYLTGGAISRFSQGKPSLVQKCTRVVIEAKGPIHYGEVCKAVNTREDKPLRPWRVHCLLTSNRSLLLWGRGLFVHPDYVSYDGARVQQLAQLIVRRLQPSVPFVSVYGVYREHQAAVNAAGLPTDRAFYSALRREASDQLACNHYPYIRLSNPGPTGGGAAEFVERLVLDAEGPIAVDEVRRKLCQELGVRDSHCSQAIAQAGGVCNTGEGYLVHFEHLGIKPPAIEPVIRHALSLLQRGERVSVVRIFEDQQATCLSLGIQTPRLLYEVLDRLASGRLMARSFPQLCLPGGASDHTIREEIETFVRRKGHAVSIEEVNQVFTASRGYHPTTVYQALHAGALLWHDPSWVIHADALGLRPEHRRRVLEEACRFYETAVTPVECWATLDAFLERHEDQLPPLQGGASWTELLVHSLLAAESGIRFVGNTRLPTQQPEREPPSPHPRRSARTDSRGTSAPGRR